MYLLIIKLGDALRFNQIDMIELSLRNTSYVPERLSLVMKRRISFFIGLKINLHFCEKETTTVNLKAYNNWA